MEGREKGRVVEGRGEEEKGGKEYRYLESIRSGGGIDAPCVTAVNRHCSFFYVLA